MRAAVVGDNGQGKTTFLRTIVGSLEPLAGQVRWGYGCEIGVYAQHVYTTLPEHQTVLEYLEYKAAPNTKTQTILDVAGSLLFRGDHVQKPIPVLSGGERARLCLAGLLLSNYNVLVLDEPGNHLDVETVEALAGALCDYKGTLIFTSHDRHFMQRVATAVVEVRDGRVLDYRGGYQTYLNAVNREIDEEEQRTFGAMPATAKKAVKKDDRKQQSQRQRDARKELQNVERNIARLDDQKRQLNEQFQTVTDPAEAVKLHEQVKSLTDELSKLEERWCELQEQAEPSDQ
jgi:ATP-binding cassette subfamily F protein 3